MITVLGIWLLGLLIIGLVVLRVRGAKGFWHRFVLCCLGATIGGVISVAFLLAGIQEMIVSGLRANLHFVSRVAPISPTVRDSLEELVRSSALAGTAYLGMAIGAFVCWPHKKRAGDRDGEEVTS